MPKLTRKTQKIFASSALDVGVFGSAQSGSSSTSTDPATIQSASYLGGLGLSTLSAKRLLPQPELNGLHYVETYQLAYLMQEGLPEYDSATTYYANSLVKKSGTTQIYKSLTDNNTNNALTSTSNWCYCGDSAKMYILDNATTNNNVVINGNFNIWQRGSSFVAVADGAYTADRWLYGKNGAMVQTISRDTDVPTASQVGFVSNYSLKISTTTADTSITAAKYSAIRQIIEGYNWATLAQQPFTLSFWVKSSITGTFFVSFSNNWGAIPDRYFTSEVVITAANNWQYVSINVSASPSAGTWNYTNGAGLAIFFHLAAGSTYHGTAGSWQTGFATATSNQTNFCSAAGINFWISGVQLEKGSVATPFQQRTIQQELELCQRYYEVISAWGVSYASSGTALQRCQTLFKTAKRATPSCSVSIVSGSLTSPSITDIDLNGVWIAFGSTASSIEGKFSVLVNSEI